MLICKCYNVVYNITNDKKSQIIVLADKADNNEEADRANY